MNRNERKTIDIDDVVQVIDIPIPIIAEGEILHALCPFCGEIIATSSDEYKTPSEAYTHLVVLAVPALEEHHKKCSEPKVNLRIKHVSVNFSFEGIRDSFEIYDILLTAKTFSDESRTKTGEDNSIRMY